MLGVAQPHAPCLAFRVDPEVVCQSENLACSLLLNQQQNDNIAAALTLRLPKFEDFKHCSNNKHEPAADEDKKSNSSPLSVPPNV